MTGMVEAVRDMVESTCVRSAGLEKQGCDIDLSGAPTKRLVIDFDAQGSPLGPRQTRCDYLFIGEVPNRPGWVAPIEVKNSEIKVNRVVKQLRAGAKVAEGLVHGQSPINFCPVAVARNFRRALLTELRKPRNLVPFRGRPVPVRVMLCGDSLANVLHPEN